MKILIITASLRKASLNAQLGQLAANFLKEMNVEVDLQSLRNFDTISYNADIEKENGIPAEIELLKTKFQENDGFIIVSPEYNGSIPGALKNVIDWASRIKPMPYAGKWAYLMSASPSLSGGNQALWALRVPFEKFGTFVHPNMFSLASAHEAFNEDGSLKNKQLEERLKTQLKQFIEVIK